MSPENSHAASVKAVEITQTGQSSVRDWQAALVAAGYQVSGPMYVTISEQSRSPTQYLSDLPRK